MKRKVTWTVVSVLVVLGLLASVLSCAAPTPTPTPTPTPKPTPTPTPTPAPTPAAPEVITWKCQSCFGTVAPYGRFPVVGVRADLEYWKDWIEAATDGRLVIDIAEPGAIFAPAETLSSVEAGVVDMAFSFGAYYSGTLPEGGLEISLPFAWETSEETWDCFYNYGLADVIAEAYAEHNCVWIPAGSGAIYNIGTTFAAPNPEALKGKKIRAVGISGAYVEALGASPVPTPWGEMYMALKLGTVDGYVGGSAALEENKLKEVLTGYIYPPNNGTAVRNFVINMDSFNALPEDIQEMIKRDTPAIALLGSCSWHQQCEWCLAHAEKDYGMTIYSWSPEDITKVRQKCIEEIWPEQAAKSPRMARCVEILMEQARDYGKLK